MTYPRSKIGVKNIVLILVAILIVAGAFGVAEYFNANNKKVVYEAVISPSEGAISSDLQSEDSDADGLKDWEEVLLGTDPHNPDTDKDGTSDGKEVSLGRNPLVKGPGDRASDMASSSRSLQENLTETDKLARDFFARYMELRQTGLSKDKQSQQDLVGTVLKHGIVVTNPKVYMTKDIITSSDDSVDAIKKYGNEVGAIFKKYPQTGRDETVIAKESATKEDPEILKEIDPIISTYKNIINGFLKVRTPQSMASMHVDLINAMSKFLFVADSLRQGGNDALRSLQGASKYLEAGKSLIDAMQAIRSQLVSQNISYSSGEPGIIFFQ